MQLGKTNSILVDDTGSLMTVFKGNKGKLLSEFQSLLFIDLFLALNNSINGTLPIMINKMLTKVIHNINYFLHIFLKFININFALIFDEEWYLSQYPDVQQHGLDPLRHWVFHGLSENRDPTFYMFTKFYLNQIKNYNVLLSFSPTIHFYLVGKYKKITPHPLIPVEEVRSSKLSKKINNNNFKNDLLRTPNRINVSHELGNLSELFHTKDVYVSNVDRAGEITVVAKHSSSRLNIEIYKFEDYSLQKLMSRQSGKLDFIVPSRLTFTPRKLDLNSGFIRQNSILREELLQTQKKLLKNDLSKIEKFNSLLRDFYLLVNDIRFDMNNQFLLQYMSELSRVCNKSKQINSSEFVNLYVLRDVIRRYYKIYSPFLNAGDKEGILSKTNISLILSSKRPYMLTQILKLLKKQSFRKYELMISLHGMSDGDVEKSKQLINKFSSESGIYCKVWQFSSAVIISEILNIMIINCKFEFIAKIDDDDIYGENHLLDLVVFSVYSNADFIGKSPMFIYDEDTTTLYFDNSQYRYFDRSDEISGSSMIFKKSEVLNLGGVPLCVKNPDYVLRQLFKYNQKNIFRIYGFNHVIYRSNLESHKHTWEAQNILNEKIPLMKISRNKLIASNDFWQI